MTKDVKQLGSQVPIIGESFENRRNAFLKGINDLGTKHKIALIPQMKYTKEGITPEFLAFDVNAKAKDKPQETPERKE